MEFVLIVLLSNLLSNKCLINVNTLPRLSQNSVFHFQNFIEISRHFEYDDYIIQQILKKF